MAHAVDCGVFLICVARAVAPAWEVTRTPSGKIANLAKKKAFVNHYSFHIMDPEWGHLTIKMSGHPPFGAQVILNGHEYVAVDTAPPHRQHLVYRSFVSAYQQVRSFGRA